MPTARVTYPAASIVVSALIVLTIPAATLAGRVRTPQSSPIASGWNIDLVDAVEAGPVRSVTVSDPYVYAAFGSLLVVLDVASGDILAMVSHPTFDRSTLASSPDSVWKDELNIPYLNRSISKSYQPGSIVKPLMLAGAATMNRIGLTETIDCRGHYFPDKPLLYRCWIYKQSNNSNTHGPLDGAEAIRRALRNLRGSTYVDPPKPDEPKAPEAPK